MTMSDNLPPGVTDAMVDEACGFIAAECEDCHDHDGCFYNYDLDACLLDREADAADRANDAAKDGDR